MTMRMATMPLRNNGRHGQPVLRRHVHDPVFEFFTCPRKHKLPHRVKGKGRCSPFDCCDARTGAHGVVRQEQKRQLKEASAYAEETAKLMTLKDRMRAWNEVHAVPVLPPPPPDATTSIQQYMKKRMEQAAPLALEMKLRKMALDPDHAGLAQADDVLDRAGFTRNPGQVTGDRGPVYILNFDPAKHSPYEAQKRLNETTTKDAIDGEYREESNVITGDGDDDEGGRERSPDRAVGAGGGDKGR